MRAMFMTGQYPHANGVLGNCNSRTAPHGYELSQSARTWSDVLADNGYSLGYIGKWHLGSPFEPYVKSSNNTEEMAWNEWCPPERRHGFDFWYAYGTYDQQQPAHGRRGVHTERYTLMISKMPGEPRETVLHDNVEDPYQLKNVADEMPDVVERLIEDELVPWLQKTADPWLGTDR
jgi:arylsulfatase A-like enzyme